jgi:hypothetical protein
LTDDRINLLFDLQFDFSMQTNVVGAKLMVPMAISKIFKYKKENGNISIPNKDPHKQLRRWITHAKDASKKIIEQGNGNSIFTLPNLKFLNELGITKLPTNFKLKEATTPKAATKKETKKKTKKVPPRAKAQGARSTVSSVSVVAPKKKITAARPKAKAPIEPKKKVKTPLKSPKVPSQPTHTSPRRAATAIDMPHQEEKSFHSIHNNPFYKLKYMPAQMFTLSSSLLPAGGESNVESATSEFPSTQTNITFNRIEQLAHSFEIVYPHPSPDTVNRMESAHPNPSCPSPPMPAA